MADLFDDIDVAAAPEAPGARGEQVLADVGAVEVPRSDHSVASGPSEFVVKCRGLPWQVQLEDVGSFFSGCDLIPGSLLFTFNSRGDCFALFATAEGHHKALAKDRQSMGSRYIEVERSDLAEYTRARDEEALPDGLERCVIKARGFPPQFLKADVRAAAAAYRLAPVASSEQLHASGRPHAAIVGAGIGAFLADNVYWGVKSDGAPSGDAFLIFEGKEEAERATEGKLEGLASLQLHLTTKGEVYGHLAQYERNGLGVDADYRGVVRLHNAPFIGAEAYYKMSEEACGLVPADVAVPRNPDGRFSGDAFVTYATEEDAAAAEKKLHGYRFQGRSLDASLSSRALMYAAMGGSWMVPADSPRKVAVLLCNLPFQLSPDELLHFIKSLLPDAVIGLSNVFIATQWNTGRATGEAFAVMQSEDAAVALVSVANMAKLKDRSLEARVVHKSELYNAISRPLQLGARGKPPKLSDPDSHETFVLARGVGSAATEAEIAEFFAAVQAPPRRVLLVLDPTGRPRGDAFLDMGSVEAARAAMCRNKAVIAAGRVLELALANPADAQLATQPLAPPHARGGGGGGGPPPPWAAGGAPPPRGGGGGRYDPPPYDPRGGPSGGPPAPYGGGPPPPWHGGGYGPPPPHDPRGYGAPPPHPGPWGPPSPWHAGGGGYGAPFDPYRGGGPPGPWGPPPPPYDPYGPPPPPHWRHDEPPPPAWAGRGSEEPPHRGGGAPHRRSHSRSRSPRGGGAARPPAAAAAPSAPAAEAAPATLDYESWYASMYGGAPSGRGAGGAPSSAGGRDRGRDDGGYGGGRAGRRY